MLTPPLRQPRQAQAMVDRPDQCLAKQPQLDQGTFGIRVGILLCERTEIAQLRPVRTQKVKVPGLHSLPFDRACRRHLL